VSLLAPTLQAFFTQRLATQRQASGQTVAQDRGVPEVDQGGDQQLPCGEGLRSVLACLPSPPGDGLWSGRSSTLRYGASSS
jgi:hypothetical protein